MNVIEVLQTETQAVAQAEAQTAQEVFDKIVTHLRAQGKKSLGATGIACKYRGVDGLRCAVGCLLSDDEYQPWMDDSTSAGGGSIGKVMETLFHSNPSLYAKLKPHGHLLAEMQGLHDASDPFVWEQRFEQVAKTHCLVYTPVSF